jgi:hypothetical protein
MTTTAQPVTIIEVAYEVLSRSEHPLTPEQIAASAREAGYNLTGWDVKTEIDAHLRFYGYRSPFNEIGRACYGLLPLPEPPAGEAIVITNLRRLATVAAVLVILALALLLKVQVRLDPSGGPSAAPVEVADSRPLASGNLAPAGGQAPGAAFPADPAWWPVNAQNQINQETREVAQQYLSNYYNTCGPAVVAMLASYFRAKTPGESEKVTTAQVLRDARNQLGYYTPPYNSGLLDFDNLGAIISLYGLSQVAPGGGSDLMSLDELVEGVRQGNPAIVGMRYSYQGTDMRYIPSGGRGLYNHFVVVFAVTQSEGQDYLWVMNPHPGKYLVNDSDAIPEAFRADEFKQSWALNNASDYADYGHAAFYQYNP